MIALCALSRLGWVWQKEVKKLRNYPLEINNGTYYNDNMHLFS